MRETRSLIRHLRRGPDHIQMEKEVPKIQVIIRKRPLNRKEQASNDADVVATGQEGGLLVRETK